MDDKKVLLNEKEYQGVGGFLVEIIKVFALALIIIIPIRVFLFQPFFVQGASMEPNFNDGEYLIVNELGYKKTKISFGNLNIFTMKNFRDLKRGDVIVFRYPKSPSHFFIKRVIAVAGERVEIMDGEVIVYNEENPKGIILDEEKYLPKKIKTEGNTSFNVEEGEIFVLGDNRGASSDSRVWGLVGEDDVIGKVALRAWPINKFSLSF
ncbi:MAG: signal peptidase I [Candidatus Moranbacteria bacterium]|nr:signal peptidase I [Candidatus Moranbacteria bacterium]